MRFVFLALFVLLGTRPAASARLRSTPGRSTSDHEPPPHSPHALGHPAIAVHSVPRTGGLPPLKRYWSRWTESERSTAPSPFESSTALFPGSKIVPPSHGAAAGFPWKRCPSSQTASERSRPASWLPSPGSCRPPGASHSGTGLPSAMSPRRGRRSGCSPCSGAPASRSRRRRRSGSDRWRRQAPGGRRRPGRRPRPGIRAPAC